MFTKENKYLFLIIVIFIAACIETDIYLPAFTDMMAYFSISEEKIQSLLTWNFVGICISSPFYGPISDAIGRKKPLIAALGIFFIGSIITLFAGNFELMLLGRVLQGLGSGGCFTLGTAIIFDAFQEKQAMIAINKLNSIVPFIMAGAPLLGGYLNLEYGFRSNFLAIAVLVLASMIISMLWFEETLSTEKRAALNFRKLANDFKKVSLSIPFWQTTLIVSLIFSGYLVFLSGISVLFVIEYEVSKQVLPIYQASLLGAWVLASLIYERSVKYLGIENIKITGTIFSALGGLSLVAVVVLAPENPILLTIPMLLYTFGANWIQSIYFPEGMDIFPDIKGLTSSLLTSGRLLITAAIVGLASAFYNETIYPIVIVIASIVCIILLTQFCYERKRVKLEPSVSNGSVGGLH
jgi:DHA1 family bicyclomycin/chloramphenicol resistance-like MFS transporter